MRTAWPARIAAVMSLVLAGCVECKRPDALKDGVYVTSLTQDDPLDQVTVRVAQGIVTIDWTLEDGSVRTVAYTAGPVTTDPPEAPRSTDTADTASP